MNQPKLHAVADPETEAVVAEEVVGEAKPMPTVHMNRFHSPGSDWAILDPVYERPCITFSDTWQWDFDQIRTSPVIGSVQQIVNAHSDEPTLGSEVMPLFSQILAKEWSGKTVLFPRTIFVGKGWGKAILGYVVDENGVCKPEVFSFNHNFDKKVYVVIWKQ
jgi:hypothetical protein